MKITEANILADLHTHTVFSLHAFSTTKENIECAKKQCLKAIAITDHLWGNGDEITLKNEFSRIAYQEETINETICIDKNKGFFVIGGAEFNIGQEIPEGKDYWDKIKNLKWRPIGLHSWFYDREGHTLFNLYNQFNRETINKKHNAIAHLEREIHKINYGKNKTLNPDVKAFLVDVVKLAKERDVYLEVNESSLKRDEGGAIERLKYWLEYAKQNGNKICLGTDAHYCEAVGKFPRTIELLNQIEYPVDLILNCNYDMFYEEFIK